MPLVLAFVSLAAELDLLSFYQDSSGTKSLGLFFFLEVVKF